MMKDTPTQWITALSPGSESNSKTTTTTSMFNETNPTTIPSISGTVLLNPCMPE